MVFLKDKANKEHYVFCMMCSRHEPKDSKFQRLIMVRKEIQDKMGDRNFILITEGETLNLSMPKLAEWIHNLTWNQGQTESKVVICYMQTARKGYEYEQV